MNPERTYAAVHLGESTISVLLASGSVTTEGEYDVEHSPLAFVDDQDMFVGGPTGAVVSVFGDAIAAALSEAGAEVPLDLLEIACPSTWGATRHGVVRRATVSLAREVLVVDSATAAVQSSGERAPSFAVVVEIGDLFSIVSTMTADSEPDGRLVGTPGAYARSGSWEAVGSRDLQEEPGVESSVYDRVATAVGARNPRDPVDVWILVRGSAHTPLDSLEDDARYRIHRLHGLDIVRSMAGRAGISTPSAAFEGSVFEPTTAAAPAGFHEERLPYEPPMSSRAAAWLDDVHVPSRTSRRTPTVVSVVACSVALLVVAVVVTVVVGARSFSDPPAPVAASSPSSESPTSFPQNSTAAPNSAAPPDHTAPPDRTASPGIAPTVEASPRPSSGPSAMPAPTVTVSSTPGAGPARFSFGRVSVELPATWEARAEERRVVLVPPDFPDRRIVLATTELEPGTSLNDVAADLATQIEARGEDSTIGELVPATDFGGRVGISYIESPGDESVVLWRVFVEDGLQISVGCQSSAGSENVLEEDCSRAMSTLTVVPVS